MFYMFASVMYFFQLLWVLEHLASITSQPAETPNERNFQAQYGDTINSALLQLRNPDNFTSPHTVWEPFKEVSGNYSVILNLVSEEQYNY